MTASSPAFPLPGAHDSDHAALVSRVAAADASVRRIALLELADLEDPNLVPTFVAALRDDPSADVRGEAARVLAAWEQPDVVDALCRALLDPDDGLLIQAVKDDAVLTNAALRWFRQRQAGVEIGADTNVIAFPVVPPFAPTEQPELPLAAAC